VAFVSLMNASESEAKGIVEQFEMPWPCGFGVTKESIALFGALNPGARIAGYDVSPTLYLIGPDHRILWTDSRARMGHIAPGPLMRELETAIEKALTNPQKK
jgi:hypothetical protein